MVRGRWPRAVARAAETVRNGSANGGSMDKEILVIEDEPQLARLVAMHLGDAGCRVEVALTGAEGLAHAA